MRFLKSALNSLIWSIYHFFAHHQGIEDSIRDIVSFLKLRQQLCQQLRQLQLLKSKGRGIGMVNTEPSYREQLQAGFYILLFQYSRFQRFTQKSAFYREYCLHCIHKRCYHKGSFMVLAAVFWIAMVFVAVAIAWLPFVLQMLALFSALGIMLAARYAFECRFPGDTSI